MAEKTEFLQAIDDAILDADSLEQFINGSDSETVLTRLSAEYPTLQKAIKELFEDGGLPATPFATKALMEASELADGAYAMVTDDTVNNGLYVKTSGAWVKSSYDPLTQAKAYADQKLSVFYGADEFANNGFILSSGTFLSSETFRATDFLEVLGGHYYTIKADVSGNARHAWYDKDKVFVSSFVGVVGGEITVEAPETARYLRASTRSTYADKSYVSGEGVNIRGVVEVMDQHQEVINEIVDEKTSLFLRHDSPRVPLTQDQDEYIFAVTDQNRKMTDLVVRKSDGQVPDWVIDRWSARLNIVPPVENHSKVASLSHIKIPP